MKILLSFLFLMLSFNLFAADFSKIFKEIKNAKSSKESIEIRKKYLGSMKNLNDYTRLIDLEKLNPGEVYFNHYLRELGTFAITNVDYFMFDGQSYLEREMYARKIVSKAYTEKDKIIALEKGLFYVADCETFNEYISIAKASTYFSQKYYSTYCHNNHYQHYKLFELISNTVLKEGEYKTIYLPGPMKISKLYISVEGLYRDSYFDVMVNGDIKGTIYAPSRDPLYIINVQDTTNSIELRSMVGDAHISSIKVEYK